MWDDVAHEQAGQAGQGGGRLGEPGRARARDAKGEGGRDELGRGEEKAAGHGKERLAARLPGIASSLRPGQEDAAEYENGRGPRDLGGSRIEDEGHGHGQGGGGAGVGPFPLPLEGQEGKHQHGRGRHHRGIAQVAHEQGAEPEHESRDVGAGARRTQGAQVGIEERRGQRERDEHQHLEGVELRQAREGEGEGMERARPVGGEEQACREKMPGFHDGISRAS